MASFQRERRSSKEQSPVVAPDDPQSSQSEDKIKNQETPCSQPLHNPPNRTDIEKRLQGYILGKIDDGPPARYQLKPERVNLDRLSDEESKLRRFTIGKRNPSFPNKTTLLVGETGSGKSTLINALVNFVMGVKFEDKVWFEIIEDEKDSGTKEVSVYEVFGFEGKAVPYSLTIIDTPGYGRTEVIEHAEMITMKLHNLFCLPGGVDTVDAVGLVLKSTENHLDEKMAYIFNSVTSIFGKDMENNIVAMMTHSDGKEPTAIQAIEEANIKCARDENNELINFLFDNCQNKIIEKRKAAEKAASTAFKTSEDGMIEFTNFLNKCTILPLKTCVEVMKEQLRLSACIQNIRERVTYIEEQQDAMKKNKEELLKHKQLDESSMFQEREVFKTKTDINDPWDTHAVTCLKCEETCHYPGCTCAWDPSWCEVMKDGKCTSCSGKCPVEKHVKEKWRFVTKTGTVETTIKQMNSKYKRLEKEMDDLQQNKNQYLDEAFNIIEQLESIALNVDSVSTYVHLEFLIEKMEENGDTEKVQKLIKYQTGHKNKRSVIEKQIEKHIFRKMDDGPPARYQLKTERVNLDRLSDEDSKLRRFTLGKRDPTKENRTVLLVGETGAGKSTLINALVNFVMGVKFEDKVWFEIITDEKDRPQSDSQTSAVSVYEVFGFERKTVPYSLTIIDTPGYGDTKSIVNDKIITNTLQDLFCAPNGVDTIDAVGLVLKASDNRLDERKAYIFNSITSLFGKDMEKNIVMMMTHSDGAEPTDAFQAIEDAKIKCARDENNKPVHFLFSNCQKHKIVNYDFAQKAFRRSETVITAFLDFLNDCQTQSLNTCKKVLNERTRLTACIQNLEERVAEIDEKQEAITKNKVEVLKHKKEMDDNKNFEINLDETYKEKIVIDAWWDTKAVTCNTCKENCHHPGCTWAWSPSSCEVMKKGRCTSCSGKCPVKDHVKENKKYVTKIRTVTKTSEEMKAKYEVSKAEHEKKTTLLEKMETEMEKEMADLKQYKKQCLDEAFNIIEQLEEIALNVDSVSTYVHLEFLMEKMEENGDTEKVQKLKVIRDRMDERNRAGAKYLARCRFFFKEVKNRLTL